MFFLSLTPFFDDYGLKEKMIRPSDPSLQKEIDQMTSKAEENPFPHNSGPIWRRLCPHLAPSFKIDRSNLVLKN